MNVTWVRLSGSARWLAAYGLAFALAGITLVQLFPLLEAATLSRPSPCALKMLTGYPCLACRGTRAVFALADGDFGQAIRFNPLATLLLASLLVMAAIASAIGRLPTITQMSRPWRSLCWCLLVVALLGNWAYVIAAGG